MAVLPARDFGEIREAGVGSAFSRGDLLCLNSNSSLSRMPDAGGIDLAGIALADSTQSIRNKTTAAYPDADGIFWANIVPGSAYTAGSLATVAYSAASRFYLAASGTTTGAIVSTVVAGTSDVVQSGESRVLIQFVRNSGNLLFS